MKLNQYGSANGPTIGLVVAVVLLIASLVFGFWSFSGREKYKNNTDQLISTAVSAAKTQQQKTDSAASFIAAQNPLAEYIGPSAYGTITMLYPKTWSSYVDSSDNTGYPVNGFFYPGTLPSVTDDGGLNFALRLQVENQPYTTVLQYFTDEIKNNLATVTAYSLPKMPSVVGVKVVGQLSSGITGTVIILPLRTEALEVWTEGTAYLSEFNSDILPNLSFSP
jgi:hypothetical protein